jgi:PfaD family protein
LNSPARTASCPSCGAPLRFRGATSVVAVCGFCKATVVRDGVNLENIGKQAELLEDHSPIRIGAAGGLGTPASVASAFALGASYVMTGTVNEAAVESGLSEAGRLLLAQAGIADVAMAPAADMFEMGVKVQVLRRGTMFATRAQKLYDAYMAHDSIESLPPGVRSRLESEIFKAARKTFDKKQLDAMGEAFETRKEQEMAQA